MPSNSQFLPLMINCTVCNTIDCLTLHELVMKTIIVFITSSCSVCASLIGAVSPIMKTEPKINKTELFRSNFWQKNRAKTEHLIQKKTEQNGFFTYSFTSATKIPKKISGYQWGSIKVVILILNQIPRPPVRIFR